MEKIGGESYVNERGEIVRSQGRPEREVSVEEKIYSHYSGILIQNDHPDKNEQPEDVLYWKGERLENVKNGIGELETLAVQNNITEIINPWNSNERVDLREFVNKVRKSIEYSESLNQKNS